MTPPPASATPLKHAFPPRLWNPNAACLWSYFLSPAFGAALHALKWWTLGHPQRARTNLAWVGGTVVLTVAYAALRVFLTIPPLVKMILFYGPLLGWYFTQGVPQIRYVRDHWGTQYLRRSWLLPLCVGGGLVVYGVSFEVRTAAPDPSQLAAEVKLQILQHWRRTPELQGATIQKISLNPGGDQRYFGSVEATLDGQPLTLQLEVVSRDGRLAWELKPQDGG